MKIKYRFMGLVGFLVWFGAGANAYANPESIPDELLENLPTIESEIPNILPGFGSEYTMKFVTPTPGIDCKIVKVTPDPDIDYKIRIINPGLRKMLTGIDNRADGITREMPWKK